MIIQNIVSLFHEKFCTNYSFLKSDLLPYCWKTVKYQDVMSETCHEKVQLRIWGLTSSAETTLVSALFSKWFLILRIVTNQRYIVSKKNCWKNPWAKLVSIAFIVIMKKKLLKEIHEWKRYSCKDKIWYYNTNDIRAQPGSENEIKY